MSTGDKRFHRRDNVGTAKYTINFHDGMKTHVDGSDFFDIATFKSKKEMHEFTNRLIKDGYRET